MEGGEKSRGKRNFPKAPSSTPVSDPMTVELSISKWKMECPRDSLIPSTSKGTGSKPALLQQQVTRLRGNEKSTRKDEICCDSPPSPKSCGMDLASNSCEECPDARLLRYASGRPFLSWNRLCSGEGRSVIHWHTGYGRWRSGMHIEQVWLTRQILRSCK